MADKQEINENKLLTRDAFSSDAKDAFSSDANELNAMRDALWKLYQEQWTHCRHHETMRATVTNIALVVAGVAIAIIGYDKEITLVDLPAALFLIGLGIFGAGFSSKLYERYHLHLERSRNFLDALDTLLTPKCQKSKQYIKALKMDADERHDEKFKNTNGAQGTGTRDKEQQIHAPEDGAVQPRPLGHTFARDAQWERRLLPSWSLERWWSILYFLVVFLGVILSIAAVNNFVVTHTSFRLIVI